MLRLHSFTTGTLGLLDINFKHLQKLSEQHSKCYLAGVKFVGLFIRAAKMHINQASLCNR